MTSKNGIKNYSERITRGILGFPHRKRFKDLSEICRNYQDREVLDIGCQDLFFDSDIIPYQKRLVGCDLGWDDAFCYAKENIKRFNWNNVWIIKSVGEYLPFSNKIFNMILCFETMEHVTDESMVIEEVDRVSTDDSIFIVSVPIEFGIVFLIKELFRKIFYTYPKYSVKELFYGTVGHMDKIKRIRHEHKGYYYKNTMMKAEKKFKLVKKINTPFRFLPDILSYGTILIFEKNISPDITVYQISV